jgi:hypothetical protein
MDAFARDFGPGTVELPPRGRLSGNSSGGTMSSAPLSTPININYDLDKSGGGADVLAATHLSEYCQFVSAISLVSIASNVFSWIVIALLVAFAKNEYFSWCYLVERVLNIVFLILLGGALVHIRFHMRIAVRRAQFVMYLLTFLFSSCSLVEFYMEVNSLDGDPFFKSSNRKNSESDVRDSFPLAIVLLVMSSLWELGYLYHCCYVYVNNHVSTDTYNSSSTCNKRAVIAPAPTAAADENELDGCSTAECVATPSSSTRSATDDTGTHPNAHSVWAFGHLFTSPSSAKANIV